ncbi:MAG: class I adenylate-forming enzyme family protein [Burkholderiaceae bacterium]
MAAALATALIDASLAFGRSIALTGAGLSLTYESLLAQASRVGEALAAAGLRRDEPVHVLASNHPHDVVALFGVWLAGGVVVPVHRTTPAPVAAGTRARTGARFQLDGPALTWMAGEPPPMRPLLAGAAFIVFTSGSTGEPKGVVVAHDAFRGKLRQIDSLLRFGPTDRTSLILNLTFSFGLWLSLLTLIRGGTLAMHEKFESQAFCNQLIDDRITRVGMVPTMMRVLFSDPASAADIDRVTAAGDLAQISIGGESLGRSLADTIRSRFAATRLIDIYGLTETATCDFFAFPDDYAKYPGCIGRPSPNVAFRIVDRDDRVVDSGAVGELQIATPYVMAGYLDAPALTAAAFSDGWFRTGDLARCVADDVVALMGRKKEVISRGGNKVTPVEIEQSLCTHPDVAAAMAVGIDDPLLGQRIHVLLVPRPGARLAEASVRAFLHGTLERYKHPDRYYAADALPTGRTGKADRTLLRSLIEDGLVTRLPA